MEILFGGLLGGLLLGGLFFGILTAAIAGHRGRSGCLWFIIGFFTGPIGTVAALLFGHAFRCPYCREGVQEMVSVCPHCRSKIGVADKPPKW